MIREAIDQRIGETEERLKDHMDEKINEIRKIFSDHVSDAFPAGPLVMHRAYHEKRIKSSEATERIKTDLFGWIIKGAIGVVFVLVGMGALEWLKREISK